MIPQKWRDKIPPRIRFFGFRFRCPCCGGTFRVFHSFGTIELKPNSLCPGCCSLGRHRLLWMYLKNKTNFFKKHHKLLHLSPWRGMQENFKRLTNIDYTSADMSFPWTMLKIDIANIRLPDSQFDCIICYHVLEHIPDDTKAIKELSRVLKPGGWAIIQSPIDPNRASTFEDPGITEPAERERVFGQRDHVRIYGTDYKERLEAAGFKVKIHKYAEGLSKRIIKRCALPKEEEIYFCSKN